MELGASFGLLEQLQALAHLAAYTERIAPCRLGIQHGFGIHARLHPLQQWPGRTTLHPSTTESRFAILASRRGVDGPHRSQTARAARRWLRRVQC